ncbi:MAG: phospho-N-acetylmuramoyl-pentapeptide-transferase [Acidaminococcales bacterium]|jgi:phospho-N-acetylmuramoyl-pentapeptide-transferase|nr:phospho-N-acetylmuramoyl-pentapeptide-transferase [Acidaminococcales bacterium]
MMNSFLAAEFSAFVVSAASAVLVIPFLRRLKFGQSIREYGPREHLKKAGTPTMGGLIILPGVILPALLLGKPDADVFLAMLLFVGSAAIGFADDYIKVALKRNLGLTAKQKLLAQALLAVVFLLCADSGGMPGKIYVPFWGALALPSVFYAMLVILLFVGTLNAVNLTDGLDGLAAGATVPVAAAYAAICFLARQESLGVFAMALGGACAGFLLFNFNPAKIFMGDTGSMALGGAVAALALLTGTEFLLIVVGGLYVVEALSVIIQVAVFKSSGKRVFRMSPLHHHFELVGWPERKVVVNFWLLSAACAFSGLLIYIYG